MKVALQTIAQITAKIPNTPPWVARLAYPVDLLEDPIGLSGLASWLVRLEGRLNDEVLHCDPPVRNEVLEVALPVILRELVPAEARRAQVECLVRDLKAGQMKVFRSTQARRIARQIEAMVEYYLKNETLQNSPLAREIAERIIDDFDFLVQNPVKNMRPYWFGEQTTDGSKHDTSNTRVTKTREFILSRLKNLLESASQIEVISGHKDEEENTDKFNHLISTTVEIMKWLYQTYTANLSDDDCIRDYELREQIISLYADKICRPPGQTLQSLAFAKEVLAEKRKEGN